MNLNSIFCNLVFNLFVKLNSIPQKIDKYELKDGSNILIIANTALGDTLLSTPAMYSLKESFPNSKITLLVHNNYLKLFKNCDFIDNLIPFYGSYNKFFRTVIKIRKTKPEISLILHGNGPQDIQFSVLSGSKIVLKHPTTSPLKKYLSYEFISQNKHVIEEKLDLVRFLGATKISTEMKLNILKDKDLLEKFSKFSKYIGFQIGAADVYKMWPIENFSELAKQLILKNEKILITGIKKESKLANYIIDDNKSKDIINMCGECTIEELPYLISNLKLLVTNDTGTMHLAIALKVPTICLFGSTSPLLIGPYQDLDLHSVIERNGFINIQNIPKKKRTNEFMKFISVSDVINEIIKKDAF